MAGLNHQVCGELDRRIGHPRPCVLLDRDLIRGGHYGQRPSVPRSKAEHMAAPTNAAGVKKVLANPEPSTHGPTRTFVEVYLAPLLGA
jgi:hypothetical protein